MEKESTKGQKRAELSKHSLREREREKQLQILQSVKQGNSYSGS